MTTERSICAVCAWRETCQKKFSISGRDVNCPEYTRDISIKDASDAQESTDNTEG